MLSDCLPGNSLSPPHLFCLPPLNACSLLPQYTGTDKPSQDAKKTIQSLQYLKAKSLTLYSFAVFYPSFPSVSQKFSLSLWDSKLTSCLTLVIGHFFSVLNNSDRNQFCCFKLVTEKAQSVTCW